MQSTNQLPNTADAAAVAAAEQQRQYDQILEERRVAGRLARNDNNPMRGHDSEATLILSFEQAREGGVYTLRFYAADGAAYELAVPIAPATMNGTLLRLVGAGGPGLNGGPRGDLSVRVLISEWASPAPPALPSAVNHAPMFWLERLLRRMLGRG